MDVSAGAVTVTVGAGKGLAVTVTVGVGEELGSGPILLRNATGFETLCSTIEPAFSCCTSKVNLAPEKS